MVAWLAAARGSEAEALASLTTGPVKAPTTALRAGVSSVLQYLRLSVRSLDSTERRHRASSSAPGGNYFSTQTLSWKEFSKYHPESYSEGTQTSLP